MKHDQKNCQNQSTKSHFFAPSPSLQFCLGPGDPGAQAARDHEYRGPGGAESPGLPGSPPIAPLPPVCMISGFPFWITRDHSFSGLPEVIPFKGKSSYPTLWLTQRATGERPLRLLEVLEIGPAMNQSLHNEKIIVRALQIKNPKLFRFR